MIEPISSVPFINVPPPNFIKSTASSTAQPTGILMPIRSVLPLERPPSLSASDAQSYNAGNSHFKSGDNQSSKVINLTVSSLSSNSSLVNTLPVFSAPPPCSNSTSSAVPASNISINQQPNFSLLKMNTSEITSDNRLAAVAPNITSINLSVPPPLFNVPPPRSGQPILPCFSSPPPNTKPIHGQSNRGLSPSATTSILSSGHTVNLNTFSSGVPPSLNLNIGSTSMSHLPPNLSCPPPPFPRFIHPNISQNPQMSTTTGHSSVELAPERNTYNRSDSRSMLSNAAVLNMPARMERSSSRSPKRHAIISSDRNTASKNKGASTLTNKFRGHNRTALSQERYSSRSQQSSRKRQLNESIAVLPSENGYFKFIYIDNRLKHT